MSIFIYNIAVQQRPLSKNKTKQKRQKVEKLTTNTNMAIMSPMYIDN